MCQSCEPKFKIGDKVKAIAFVDCFNKQVEEVSGLTVTKVTEQECFSLPNYYRVVAENPGAYVCFVEGAERYFDFE